MITKEKRAERPLHKWGYVSYEWADFPSLTFILKNNNSTLAEIDEIRMIWKIIYD